MTRQTEIWRLDQQVATLSLAALKASVDIARPQLGVQGIQVESQPFDAHLLALAPSGAPATWPAKVTDAYVRGTDLVATYSGDSTWPYAPQVYWSASPEQLGLESVPSLSMVVSIQTSQLDTHPRLDIRSSLSAAEVLLISLVGDDVLVDSHIEGVQGIDPRAIACGLLWRFDRDSFCYAEIMPKSDFRQLAIERTSDMIGSRWELFAEFLEKGVIRRAQLHSMFVPRENDVQLVAECCQNIERRPLPLTT